MWCANSSNTRARAGLRTTKIMSIRHNDLIQFLT